jgi:molecular chaperone GrpE
MPDVAALAAQCDDLLARLQRVSADYLNYQKRAGREVAEARQFANSALVKDLLPVLDDLERAVAAAQSHQAQAATDHPQAAALEAVLTGVRLVHEKLMSVLAGYGLKRIEADGQPFDPVLHQALVQEPSRRHASPTVLRMLVPGYEMKGRVLRPAGVVVSTGAGPGQPELPPAGPEEGEARQAGDRPQKETD